MIIERRLTGCLSRVDADRLWVDLVAYRNATRQQKRYARRRYGRGWALYEVTEATERAIESPGHSSGESSTRGG